MTSCASAFRIGIIGLGAVSPDHISGFAQMDAPITAVCDVDRSITDRVATQLDARNFNDYRELLSSGLVDAVDILLPHYLHEEVALAALSSGIHVLIEKPAARSSSAVTQLIDAAAANGVVFAIAENTRFVKAYNVVHGLLNDGVLGEIQVVRSAIFGNDSQNLSNPSDWRGRKSLALGGAMFDGGAHSLYLLEWLFGGARSVVATTRTFTPNSEVEDFAVLTGELHSGGVYTAEFMFAVEAPWSERLEIYGSAGSCVVDQLTDPVVTYFRNGQDWGGTFIPDVRYDPTGWKSISIVDTVVDFVEAVHTGRPFGVNGEHIRRATAVIEAGYLSSEMGYVVAPSMK